MSDDFKTIREVGTAIKEVRAQVESTSASIDKRIDLTADGIKTQLKIMTNVFTACVGLATAIAGFLAYKVFDYAGPISQIPEINETVKGLDAKFAKLNDSVTRIDTQVTDARSALKSIRVAVKATDASPAPIRGLKHVDEFAFPGWRGIPVSDVKFASQVIAKYSSPDEHTWIFSTNSDFVKKLAASQPAPSKVIFTPTQDAFDGWSGSPVTDPTIVAKSLSNFSIATGQIWVYSDNPNLTSELLGKKQ